MAQVSFIDCTSLNISYNIMGIATVTYTLVQDEPDFNQVVNEISAGGQNFRGYVSNAAVSQIPNTQYYEVNVTLIATTD
jgi:hypothetical protein